jgi:cation diffusion facilitator CzcD-associated flavoprotein CzcO
MVIGIGTSGVDIAKDLAPHVDRVYMVGNAIQGPELYQAQRKSQRQRIPENGELLPEIRQFGRRGIELVDGRVAHDIDVVILATGYQYSFPFLPTLHNDTQGAPNTPTTLVTDGRGVYNLYRDVFYIPDPTLAFVGLSVNTSAFSFFEYQSLCVARVFSGTARLPDERGRRKEYAAWIAERGEGKFSHLMGAAREQTYVREVVEWLNRDAAWSGATPVEGHSEAWLAAASAWKARLAPAYGVGNVSVPRAPDVHKQPQQDHQQEQRPHRVVMAFS